MHILRAHVVNKTLLAVFFSDGTTGIFPVDDLIEAAPTLYPSDPVWEKNGCSIPPGSRHGQQLKSLTRGAPSGALGQESPARRFHLASSFPRCGPI